MSTNYWSEEEPVERAANPSPSPPFSFNTVDADIVIISSDDHKFTVHRPALSLASVVFKDLFSAPAPSALSQSNAQEFHDGHPVIRLSEDRQTLDILFKLVYPTDNPPLSTPSDILKAIAVLDKYIVEGFSRTIEEALGRIVDDTPHVVWAIARKRDLSKLIDKALFAILKKSLVIPSSSVPDEALQSMTTVELRALQEWWQECSAAAVAEAGELRWMSLDTCGSVNTRMTTGSPDCVCARTKEMVLNRISLKGNPVYDHINAADWVKNYLRRCASALEKDPHWDTIRGVTTYPSLLMVAQCPDCAAHGGEDMELVIQNLTARVRKAVEKVRRPLSPAVDKEAIRSTLWS